MVDRHPMTDAAVTEASAPTRDARVWIWNDVSGTPGDRWSSREKFLRREHGGLHWASAAAGTPQTLTLANTWYLVDQIDTIGAQWGVVGALSPTFDLTVGVAGTWALAYHLAFVGDPLTVYRFALRQNATTVLGPTRDRDEVRSGGSYGRGSGSGLVALAASDTVDLVVSASAAGANFTVYDLGIQLHLEY